jgi:hypothetical protein
MEVEDQTMEIDQDSKVKLCLDVYGWRHNRLNRMAEIAQAIDEVLEDRFTGVFYVALSKPETPKAEPGSIQPAQDMPGN